MTENGTNHMGFMEVNLDTICGSVTKILHNVSQKQFTHSQINSASSSIPVKDFYKPGGTMNVTQGNLVERIMDRGTDKYGRWVYTKLMA